MTRFSAPTGDLVPQHEEFEFLVEDERPSSRISSSTCRKIR
jgi:hypothetical protein